MTYEACALAEGKGMKQINRVLLGLSKRAERASSAQLVASFVDVGSLLASLTTNDHQVVYGRRGTGKTHVLSKLFADAIDEGHLPVQIDLRTLGSTGGIYSDPSLPISERATRLLADLLWALHDGVLERAIENESINLASLQPKLDAFRDSIVEVRVVGEVVESQNTSTTVTSETGGGIAAGLSKMPQMNLNLSTKHGINDGRAQTRQVSGLLRHRVHFGSVAHALRELASILGHRKVWLLLDEWSEIPLDLQPYLADLLRRTVFPVHGIVAKIAAIEQRTNFRLTLDESSYIGIEVGADAAASLTLDDFMVFDNNATAATNFFRSLLWKHVTSSVPEDSELRRLSENEFSSNTFTQINALQELVRAAEGVPRDAINIVSLAAQSAVDRSISVADIRLAARQWYQQSKENAISARPRATRLLQWIREEVIGARRARAFLLPSDSKSSLIDYLYDARVLHVIKKGVSSNDTPGVRYNVYAIDYGCYVDLMATSNAPQGLFQAESNQGERYVDVPATDYRSIRRAILDLASFERSAPGEELERSM
ncbi:hypothetical protein [Rhodanobacter aciditrophus]|uniref:ORC-CDC6 family AAA ATPase n=1 Tax=Rhodanobacter aciditrophus TaxID=1623218 RepID=UPI003CECC27A